MDPVGHFNYVHLVDFGQNISDPSALWQMCCTGVCILVMTVVFVLLKSSGVCLQGACEMTVTVSAESPPSSYQFFCPQMT